MSETGIWDRYWHSDRIASCFDGAGAGNYDARIAEGWRAFFAALPERSRILDLCTGNGAAALIAAEDGRAGSIVAVDRADIDPPFHVTRHADLYARIAFCGGTDAETLPFADAAFDAAISQYGIEYTNLDRSLPEAVRVLAPGGRLRFVVHAADGVVARDAAKVIADADYLLKEIDLPGAAARCFEAVTAVERAGGDRAEGDKAFAVFQAALEQAAQHVPRVHDKVMIRNTGAVLLDTFTRRSAFDLEQLLAKAEETRAEIAAHRGRLAALLDAALDRVGAEAFAERLRRAGARESRCERLDNEAGLIGYAVTAQF